MSKKTYFQYTPPTKTSWDELPMNEKTDIIKSCVRNGIISLQDIRTAYNNYAAGKNILEGIPDYQANAKEFGNFLAGGGRKDNGEKVVVHQPYYAYDSNSRKIDDTLYYNVDVTLPEVAVTPTRELVGLDRLAKGINYNSNRTVGESARKAGEDAVREQRRRIEEAAERFNQQNEMHTVFPVGEVGGLPVLRMKKDPKVIGMSGTDPVGEFVVTTAVLNPVFKAAETAGLFVLGRYGSRLGLDAEQNWARSVLVNREMSKPTIGIPEGFLTIKPNKRTRVGDVEVDNPNLLYHLDRGNSAGAFSNQGAYVENGILFPGVAKSEGQLGYSWWNEGKPYATSVKGQPMTRLMTATKDTPGMLQVRSQSYPIGQWTGSKGFVLPSEYVNSEGVNVSGSTYTLDPTYGWRKVSSEETPIIGWTEAQKVKPFQSSLDWSSEGWFGRYRPGGKYDAEDAWSLASHVPEYNRIEAAAKQNGTWMRDANGQIQRMDPREWVIRQSEDYKKAGLTGTRHYNGVAGEKALNYEYNGDAWTDLEKSISQAFKNSHTQVDGKPGVLLQLDYPANVSTATLEAQGKKWYELPESSFIEWYPPQFQRQFRTADEAVHQSAHSGHGATKINNIIEGNNEKVTDVVIHAGTPRKSILGNNGNFDMSSKNIYKGLLPFTLGLGVTKE